MNILLFGKTGQVGWELQRFSGTSRESDCPGCPFKRVLR